MANPDSFFARAYDAGPGGTWRPVVVALAFAAHADNERVRAALQAAVNVVENCDWSHFCMAPGYDWKDLIAGLIDMMPHTESVPVVAKLDEWAADRVGECV